jgi:hypothetical protein
MRQKNWTSIWIDELNSGRFTKQQYLKVCFLFLPTRQLPDQNIVNAIGLHSPDLIGFLGYEWNFQDRDPAGMNRRRQLMHAGFSHITIFHGNHGYFKTKKSSLMQLVWWMVYPLFFFTTQYNPDQAEYYKNVRPGNMIEEMKLTAGNYKDSMAEIWLRIETGGWN